MVDVVVVSKKETVELLVDPMRRAILGFLSDREMTETQLSRALGLTEAAVGHHLKLLKAAGLVRVVRRMPESHGIVQKFYRASALYFAIDQRNLPLNITRYFYPVNVERARGVLSTLAFMLRPQMDLTTEMVEELSERLAGKLVEVAIKHNDSKIKLDREQFIIKLYSQALRRVFEGDDKLARHLREVVKEIQRTRSQETLV